MKPTQEWAEAVRSGRAKNLNNDKFPTQPVETPVRNNPTPPPSEYFRHSQIDPTASAKVPWWIWVILILLALAVGVLGFFLFSNKDRLTNTPTAAALVDTVMLGVCESKIRLMRATLNQFYAAPRAKEELKRNIQIQWTGLCPKTVWQSHFKDTTIRDSIDFTKTKLN